MSVYDYLCRCGVKEERSVQSREEVQHCRCGQAMTRLFSPPDPRRGYRFFKPFRAITIHGEPYITSERQWKGILKSEGLIEGYRGGGRTLPKESLEWAEDRINGRK